MQLSKTGKISGALALATSALLNHASAAPQGWDVDGSFLLYSEDNGRVTDASLKSLAVKPLNDDDTLSIGVQLDALTGATPNGAVPANVVQTFTRPSGNGGYSVNAGETPLDSTFKDTRASLNGSWTHALDSDNRLTLGGSASKEFDYLHLGANAGYALDLNNKNTTLSIAAALSADSVDPVGGTPVAFADVLASSSDDDERDDDDDDGYSSGGSESKTLIDLVAGVTQVINRRSLIQLNYSLGLVDGYMNDPYKFLSVVDSNGELVSNGSGDYLYRYENRPDTRTGHNLFAGYKYHFEQSVADWSYRFHTDDWGIDSHTAELRHRFLLQNDSYLEPHFRYYTQTAADFYQPVLLANTAVPQYASADYRLAAFDAVTLGMKIGRKLGDGDLSLRLERYQSSGDSHPAEAVGVLAEQDLYPDLGAWIAQLSYGIKW